MVSIPKTNTNYENTSIFLEDYSYQGHQNILSWFYNTLLHGKAARDEESREMLDLIFSNPILDMGIICEFGGCPATLNSKTASFASNVVFEFKASETLASLALKNMMESLTQK